MTDTAPDVAADVLDPEVVAELLTLGPALREVLPSWDETFRAGLAQLERAAARGACVEVRRLAHGLKGSSACMAAAEVARRCDTIQRAAQDGHCPTAVELVLLRAEHERAFEAFRAASDAALA